MKKTLSIIFIIIAVLCTGFGIYLHCMRHEENETDLKGKSDDHYEEGWQYNYGLARHGEDISILVDYSIPSSDYRFFVLDNKSHKEISKSKCAHGCGGGSTASKPVFSNAPGSDCSSLGVYRLLYNDKMRNNSFPCIRLKGLDSTNSNAFARGIVIHEGPVMADDITLGVTIPVSPVISQGCFSISFDTFHILQNLVKEKKTIYLYAFDSSPQKIHRTS